MDTSNKSNKAHRGRRVRPVLLDLLDLPDPEDRQVVSVTWGSLAGRGNRAQPGPMALTVLPVKMVGRVLVVLTAYGDPEALPGCRVHRGGVEFVVLAASVVR